METELDEDVYYPPHYTSYVVEPMTFIILNNLPFWQGNIVKYAVRAGKKLYPNCDAVQSEIKDLEKVRRYAEMRINQLKGAQEL